MSRRVVWLQLLIGWLPIWALFSTLVMVVHQMPVIPAAMTGLRVVVAAAVLGLGVLRFAERHPWPARVRPAFAAMHLMAAAAYATAWLALNSLIESLVNGRVVGVAGGGIALFLISGVWIYVMVAGVSYTTLATERAGRAEADVARARLAALRSQLNPHFLFNALHTVVQLIPREPARAAQAAEQLAELLRTTIEEDRDVVALGEELAFVERYLELERVRFGERLRVHVHVDDEVRAALLPSFAVQTLVENAVRHGAAPRVEPTDVTIEARRANEALIVTVRDNGAGSAVEPFEAGGTGLKRLRERLLVLYGGRSTLQVAVLSTGGVSAIVTVPLGDRE